MCFVCRSWYMSVSRNYRSMNGYDLFKRLSLNSRINCCNLATLSDKNSCKELAWASFYYNCNRKLQTLVSLLQFTSLLQHLNGRFCHNMLYTLRNSNGLRSHIFFSPTSDAVRLISADTDTKYCISVGPRKN